MIQPLKYAYDNQSIETDRNTSDDKSPAQVRAEFVSKLMDRIQGTDFDSEEERAKYQAKIEQKIKSGAKLSQKEMNYLRRYNPYMYQQMVRVQQKREALKEQLKHCKTKEEAQRVIGAAFSSISDKDPVKEAMVAAVNNVSEQFRKSDAYKKLPDTDEDLKKIRKAKEPHEDPFKQDAEADEEGNGEISYSFSLSGYQEAAIGESAGGMVFSING